MGTPLARQRREGAAVLPQVRLLPLAPGVYRFRDAGGRILYIGRATELRRRVASYWGSLRDRRHLRRMVPQIARVEAVECASEHEAAWLERNLLERGRPRWNRTTGTESIVYIGLHQVLDVRHDPGGPGRSFGPYLGGDKVRLAVSGLDRAMPLAYAGVTLGGFDRDLARVRGIEPGSRPELAATIEAVLEREPTAGATVRSALVQRRDAAAAVLAFELAARIQEEIAALDWVLAEQRVAMSMSTVDIDIHGWADGVLVSFQLRTGRLRAWTQRPCGEAAAAGRVLATPEGWRAFAARNAMLAARLAQYQ
jgi:excinuclease ABC subunit C